MNDSSGKSIEQTAIRKASADRADTAHNQVSFTWHGCAHYHIQHQGKRIVIDPLYHRPAGATPHLPVTRQDVDGIDYLLLTHAHMDHSWDFPFLAARHQPQSYGPGDYLTNIQKKAKRWGMQFNPSKLHALESAKGQSISIGDIEVTPYQIGTEKIDFWFIRTTIIRPYRHLAFAAMPAAHKFLMYHLKDNCFGYHFRFHGSDKTMFYIGNLTDQVDELAGLDRIDILALPYCPANKHWLAHTRFLIGRFNPEVVLVHHYDNFWHPYTHPRYRNLNAYRQAVKETYPHINLRFSRFMETLDLEQLAAAEMPDGFDETSHAGYQPESCADAC
jgi:L-ascorbate metabolism protein UlaG (beta-lactamase superfamily)